MTRDWQPYPLLRIEVLGWIEAHRKAKGYPPSLAEIARQFRKSKAWASGMVDRLERDGTLVRNREEGFTTYRSLQLTPAGKTLLRRMNSHGRTD